MNSKYIKFCQSCGSKSLKIFYIFGNFPPVNSYHFNNKLSNIEYYSADLMMCKKCKLMQLGTVVDKKILFPKTYPYTSSTTKILRENFFDTIPSFMYPNFKIFFNTLFAFAGIIG